MVATARRISVIVDADSAQMRAEMAKAGDSEKAFADVVMKAGESIRVAAQDLIRSNSALGDSYVSMSGTARTATLQVVESVQTQMAEQRKAAQAATQSAATQERAAVATGDAAATAAGKATVAANEQVAASGRVSDAAVRSSERQAKAFGASGTALVGWGKKVVMATAGIAGASVYMAAKFEESTLRLHTQAGATNSQMVQLRKEILAHGAALGQGPEQLSESLYHVVSSMNKLLPVATRTNEEWKISEVAAKGAAVGHTELADTTYTLASAMNALHLRAGDAEHTMGTLNAIIGTGDMVQSDLLDSLKSGLLPTARAFGTDLESVGAALGVFGDEGIRGAMAGTKLRMMFALLGGPTQKSVEILKAVGVSAGDMKTKFASMQGALEAAGVSTTKMGEDLRKPDGLYVALSDLKKHLEDSGLSATAQAAVISRAFGGGRTGAGIMVLIHDLGRLHATYEEIHKNSGHFAQDFAEVQKTLAFQAKELGSEAEMLGIKLGNKLVPKAKELVGTLRETVDWLHKNKDAARALEDVVGIGLSVAVGAFTVNKLGKMLEGLREASRLLKLPGIAGAGTAGGTSGVAQRAASNITGGIYGVAGPEAPGSVANPIMVRNEGGGGGGHGVPPIAAPAAAAEGATAAERMSGRLVTEKQLSVAAGLATVLAGFAAENKPGVVQTPGNDVNAFAHGAGHFVEAPFKAAATVLGIHMPNITNALLPTVKTLGFDPQARPDLAAIYILTGMKPLQGVSAAKTAQQRAFATKQSPGHAEATLPGVHSPSGPEHINAQVGAQRVVESDKAMVAAHRDLLKSGEEVREQEEILNTKRKQGEAGTSSYKQAIVSLATAEGRHAKAVADMATSEARHFIVVRQQAESEMAKADAALKAHPSSTTISTITANYNRIVGAIKGEMSAGVLSVTQGTEQINAALSKEGKLLGISIGAAGLSGLEKGKAAVKAAGHARGGLIQLGRPGEPGRDTIPLNVGGIPIVAGAGETVAVLTRHQRAEAEAKIPGGLPGLFANKRPNYMASGGVVRGPVSTFGPPGEPAGGTAYGSSSAAPGIAVNPDGGGGWNDALARSFAGKVADVIVAGHRARLKVIDKGPSAIGAHGPRVLDITGAGVQAMGLNPATFPTDAIGEAIFGAGGPAVGGSGVAAAIQKILAPHVKGSGAVMQLAQAALNKVAGGANAWLSAHAPAGGGTAGGPAGAVGPAGGPAGLGSFDGRSVADWIIPELQYARAHGWTGHITSGYRSPTQVISGPVVAPQGQSEHAGTQYPHGAVDFGGPGEGANAEAFRRATVGYKGRRLLPPNGFIDLGHMSGTGHAMGGIVKAARGMLSESKGIARRSSYAMKPSRQAEAKFRGLMNSIWSDIGAQRGLPAGAQFPNYLIQPLGAEGAWTQGRTIHFPWERVNQAVYATLGSGESNHARQGMVHETAHTMQKRSVKASLPLAEGGAQAWADEWTPRVFGGGYHNEGDSNYAGYATGVRARGWDWINRGQFGYASGGIVNAATGMAATAKAKLKLPKPPKAKKVSAGHKPSGALAGLIHSLGGVPDTENVKALQGFPPLLAQLSNEQGLLSKLEGLPDRSFVLQEDLAKIGPLAGLRAGMSVTEARGLKPSTQQSEVLDWIGELPSHRQLTASDIGLLHPLGTGFLKPGLPMASAAEDILVKETEANEALVHSERKVQAVWEALAEKYRDREKKIRAHEEREYVRLSKIKAQVARLTTGQLKERVKAAQDKARQNELSGDAHASEEALAENIASERSLPSKSQNKGLISKWEADKRHLSGYIRGLSKPANQTGAALVALRKNELTNEMHPLEEQLHTLGGSRTSVGSGGQYGTVAGYVKKLNEGVTSLGGKIQEGEQGTIPGLKIELEQQQQENRAANLRPAPTGEAPAENSQLVGLLQEQARQLAETVTLQGVQLATFKNFIPQIPKYEKGGPVVSDGLIYAHKGEHVVPVGGSLAVNSSAPHVETNVHVHGELAPLLRIIDERIAHPSNVRQVSAQIARRSNGLFA